MCGSDILFPATREGRGTERDRQAGFTLLEVVIALAIAGLALVLLFRAGGNGLFAVDTAGRAQQALERAQSHLAAVGGDTVLLAGEREGDDGGGYRWRLRIEPIAHWQVRAPDGPGRVTTLYDVEVAVSWASGSQNRAVVLKTERIGSMQAPQ